MNAQLVSDVESEPLFHSAHDAIRFAVTFEGRPERPAMNRQYQSPISDGIRPASKGLSGLDGAAQAGIIRSKMRALGPIADAVLIARTAPRSQKCECRRPCCSGSTRNPNWQSAINILTDELGPVLKFKRYASHNLRQAIVMRVFGEQLLLKDIAELYGVDQDTATAYYAKAVRWLRGQKAGPHHEAVEGLETITWRNINSALSECGII